MATEAFDFIGHCIEQNPLLCNQFSPCFRQTFGNLSLQNEIPVVFLDRLNRLALAHGFVTQVSVKTGGDFFAGVFDDVQFMYPAVSVIPLACRMEKPPFSTVRKDRNWNALVKSVTEQLLFRAFNFADILNFHEHQRL